MSYTYTIDTSTTTPFDFNDNNQSLRITSSGSINSTSYCIFTNNKNVSEINNEGILINNSDNNGTIALYIFNTITNIINRGTITNQNNNGPSIYNGNSFITNIHNLQYGLTLVGRVPNNYYTIIQQKSYGSIIIDYLAGTMSFFIDPSSSIDPTFIYTNIIVGLPIANIINFNGTFNGKSWKLIRNTNGAANSYNLIFSPNVYNIASSRFNDNIYTLGTTSFTLTNNISISSNQTLIIPQGFTLDISSNGGQLDNSGTIINYGTLIINGILNSTGTIHHEFRSIIKNNNTIQNNGKLSMRSNYTGNGYLYGNFISKSIIDNSRTIYDSLKLVACVYGGYIYTSNYSINNREVWTPQNIIDGSKNYVAVASSANGQHLITCVYYGYIYTSNDYGITWTPRNTMQEYNSVASSANGQYLVASVYKGYIYTSKDYGITWTPRNTMQEYNSVASSANGEYLVACVYGGYIYTSKDYGITWTPRNITNGLKNYNSVSSSETGQYLVACVYGGYIYTSKDYGITWILQPNGGIKNWVSVSSSYSGKNITACVYSEYIYTSNDYGITWTSSNIIDGSYNFNSIASSIY